MSLFCLQVISQSPKRPERVDIKVPSEVEFESEVKSRPSDFDYKNGHDSDSVSKRQNSYLYLLNF